MQKLEIKGGRKISGTIKVSGSKNSTPKTYRINKMIAKAARPAFFRLMKFSLIFEQRLLSLVWTMY